MLVTESDELSTALDAAALRWPGLSRSALLARLALEGDLAVRQLSSEDVQRRRDAIEKWAGIFTGCYEQDYLEKLREDWPE